MPVVVTSLVHAASPLLLSLLARVNPMVREVRAVGPAYANGTKSSVLSSASSALPGWFR
jgi:hypothetical protein